MINRVKNIPIIIPNALAGVKVSSSGVIGEFIDCSESELSERKAINIPNAKITIGNINVDIQNDFERISVRYSFFTIIESVLIVVE
jgi:hypothetical protein